MSLVSALWFIWRYSIARCSSTTRSARSRPWVCRGRWRSRSASWWAPRTRLPRSSCTPCAPRSAARAQPAVPLRPRAPDGTRDAALWRRVRVHREIWWIPYLWSRLTTIVHYVECLLAIPGSYCVFLFTIRVWSTLAIRSAMTMRFFCYS